MEAEGRTPGNETADSRTARPRRRLGAVAALVAGAAMVLLSLTGLAGVDGRLEAMARDTDRVTAPELRRAAYRESGERGCERDERPAPPRQGF